MFVFGSRRKFLETETHCFLGFFLTLQVLVHSPGQKPFPHNEGWYIRPGVSATLALFREDRSNLPYPYKAYTNAYCKDTDSETDVNPLKRYEKYSYPSCLSEIIADIMFNKCGCRGFNTPGTEPLCSAKQMITCYVPNINAMGYESVENVSCPQECKMISYNPVLSYADIASRFITGAESQTSLLPYEDYLSPNIIDLRIYFSTLNIVHVNQEPELSLAKIAGSLGGQMGLFLGASILSITEFAELILLLLFRCAKTCSCRFFGSKGKIENSSAVQEGKKVPHSLEHAAPSHE